MMNVLMGLQFLIKSDHRSLLNGLNLEARALLLAERRNPYNIFSNFNVSTCKPTGKPRKGRIRRYILYFLTLSLIPHFNLYM